PLPHRLEKRRCLVVADEPRLPAPLTRLRKRVPGAVDLDLAAPRREPVAEASVDRLLARPERCDRLSAFVDVAKLGIHHRAQDAAATMRRVHADDAHPAARERTAGHRELERECTRAADDLVALE